jgi:protoheme IX farnesyltransferase
MGATLRLLHETFKLRIGLSIMLCALAGLAVAEGAAPAPWAIALLAVCVLVSSASAGAFNQYAERDLDARMRRTRHRPFVTGRFRANGRWLTLIVAMTVVPVAAVAVAINVVSAAYVFLGAFVYGVVYTIWLKRRTALNIVIGGLAGSFAVLAGAAAVDPAPGPAAMLLATALFLWTPPHFWSLAVAYHADYRDARVPMLPVVAGDRAAARAILAHAVLLVIVSLLPLYWGMGIIYGAAALTGGAIFLRTSLQLLAEPGPKAAMRNFRASLLQLGLLLAGAIVDSAVI